jgi:hypothetical protein
VAAAILALIGVAGCNDFGNTFQSPTGAFISALSPANASAGGPGFTLTITVSTGSQVGFVAQTVVQWNGKNLTTVFVSATTVTATVPAALIATPGTAFVNTKSPSTGSQDNGLSNSVAFIINPTPNPLPVVSSMTPTSVGAGSAALMLTITGSSFLPTTDPSGGSQVHWNSGAVQSTLAIVSISATQIQATIPASLLTTQGTTATVTVFNPPVPIPPGSVNPPPGGGGTSANGLTFTVTAPGTPPQTVSEAVAEETPAVSADGRYVAYTALRNEHSQIFVRDTCEGASDGCKQQSMVLSAASDGTAGNDDSHFPSMSGDGRFIAFSSAATNLGDASSSGVAEGRQIFLRDTCAGVASNGCSPSTQLISTDSNGALVGAEGVLPSVSASGRFVAFLAITPSHAGNQTAAQAKNGTTNSGLRQVFVRDTCFGVAKCTPKTTRISMQPGDTPASGGKPAGPALSGGAQHVAVDAKTATIFTPGTAVDDKVFVALTGSKP